MARSLIYRLFALQIFSLLFFSVCIAQTPQQQKSCDRYHEGLRCKELVNEFNSQNLMKGTSSTLDNPMGDTKAFVNKVTGRAILLQLDSDLKAEARKEAQLALQTLSTSDAINQVGGAPSSGGSTNLVTKPTVTDFISLAAESGAFTDTLNSTTMTIQANALGLTKYFSNLPVFERWNSGFADAIQPLSFTVTLNVAQSGQSKATAASPANPGTPNLGAILLPSNNASFSSFGANYAIYKPYNLQDKNFQANWKAAVAANQKALDAAGKPIADAVNKLFAGNTVDTIISKTATNLSDWHKAGGDAEKGGNFDQLVLAYSKYDDAFGEAVLASSPDAPTNVLTLNQALDAFSQAVYTVLDQARGKPLATISYLYSSLEGKPATHAFTLAGGYLFKGDDPQRRTFLTGAQLTANFTTTIYASLPTGAVYGRLRDLQVSGEFDKPFGGTPAAPRGTWSVAAYGQYQYDPTVLNITAGNIVPGTTIPLPGDAQVLLGTAGWLGVAQGKVVINLNKGLSIPVALKWSNKTDLLKGSDVRGQIGLSYDLSALSKLITQTK
jgi:hypothetical protein